jgi:hypothetical protein
VGGDCIACSATADAYASLFSERPTMRDMARRKAILVHAVRQGVGRDAVNELLKGKLEVSKEGATKVGDSSGRASG